LDKFGSAISSGQLTMEAACSGARRQEQCRAQIRAFQPPGLIRFLNEGPRLVTVRLDGVDLPLALHKHQDLVTG
jgi:hypothetical protein